MISQKEYAQRRKKIGINLPNNSAVLLFSAELKQRSFDTEYKFRQNSHFYYLTGCIEDKSAILLLKQNNQLKTYLFVEPKNKELELWHGKRIGVKKAKKRFLVDDVFSNKKLKHKLKQLEIDYLYGDIKDSRLQKYKKKFQVNDILDSIRLLRLIKSKSEIKLIKKALKITQEAHHFVMDMQKQGKYEYEIEAELEYRFLKNGAYSNAYSSIVAGGNRANTLHYIKNDKKLKSEQLLLIDAGAEYQYYASDITRTIPVDEISREQKEIYTLVLETQEKIIGMIKPGVLRSQLQKKSIKLLTKGLIELGILKGNLQKLIKKEKYKKYYPHGIGHYMGLDVHDDVLYKDTNGNEIPLAKGMIITIEPGIYINKGDKNVPKEYRGIGVRIEDNILVTKKGYKNLSKKIKK